MKKPFIFLSAFAFAFTLVFTGAAETVLADETSSYNTAITEDGETDLFAAQGCPCGKDCGCGCADGKKCDCQGKEGCNCGSADCKKCDCRAHKDGKGCGCKKGGGK